MLNKEKGILKKLADAINPYCWIMWLRNKAFDRGIIKSNSFNIATISIGNITVGGTGKTPHTEYIVRLLKDKYNIAVLSRGYGRKSKGFLKADHSTPMTLIGDEPKLIKNKFPNVDVCVCEKRVNGISNIITGNKEVDVILLDDAYQHRHVKPGLNILLVDYNRPIWQDCVIPFGRLRESSNGLQRADMAIITKCDKITTEEREWCKRYIKKEKDIPVFFTAMQYGSLYRMDDKEPLKEIEKNTNILLVTGIANPYPLRKEIENLGAKVCTKQYHDHHNFSDNDIKDIISAHEALGKESIIITTEKDAVRLQDLPSLPNEIKKNIYIMPIEVVFLYDNEKMFNQIIENYVTENSRNS